MVNSIDPKQCQNTTDVYQDFEFPPEEQCVWDGGETISVDEYVPAGGTYVRCDDPKNEGVKFCRLFSAATDTEADVVDRLKNADGLLKMGRKGLARKAFLAIANDPNIDPRVGARIAASVKSKKLHDVISFYRLFSAATDTEADVVDRLKNADGLLKMGRKGLARKAFLAIANDPNIDPRVGVQVGAYVKSNELHDIFEHVSVNIVKDSGEDADVRVSAIKVLFDKNVVKNLTWEDREALTRVVLDVASEKAVDPDLLESACITSGTTKTRVAFFKLMGEQQAWKQMAKVIDYAKNRDAKEHEALAQVILDMPNKKAVDPDLVKSTCMIQGTVKSKVALYKLMGEQQAWKQMIEVMDDIKEHWVYGLGGAAVRATWEVARKETVDPDLLKLTCIVARTRDAVVIFKLMGKQGAWKQMVEVVNNYDYRYHSWKILKPLTQIIVDMPNEKVERAIADKLELNCKRAYGRKSAVAMFEQLLKLGAWKQMRNVFSHARKSWIFRSEEALAKVILNAPEGKVADKQLLEVAYMIEHARIKRGKIINENDMGLNEPIIRERRSGRRGSWIFGKGDHIEHGY